MADATRADRIAALDLSDDERFDLTLVDSLVTNLQAGLDAIDADSLLGPGEQLATLAVAAVRALLPMLTAEADAQLDRAERKAARAAADATR